MTKPNHPRHLRHALPAALLIVLAIAASAGGQTSATPPKMLVIACDGMDPLLLQQYRDAGVMPNFDRLIERGHFSPLGTAIPPQSPVAWSNFITGRNSGGHAIFDFVHRDPDTMIPFLSTSEAKGSQRFWTLGGWKLPLEAGEVANLREGTAFWEILSESGVDATVFKIPANFPPVECEARSLSGMGTPDILGTYGVFSYVTDSPPEDMDIAGGRVVVVDTRPGRFTTTIHGPRNAYRVGDPETSVELEVAIDPEHAAVTVNADGNRFLLQEGEWSDWVQLDYDMVPLLKSVSGVCRFYLMEVRPNFRLYITPIQIDPERPEMPISTPPQYSAEVAEDLGSPYYTQGLPEDTHALDQHVFDDADYVSQAELVLTERTAQFGLEVDRFADLDEGFFFFYFNSPDQTTHMFWRNMDPDAPLHEDAGGHFADHIQGIYEHLDTVVGMALDTLDDDTVIMVMSDHGFAPFHRTVHVNTWLLDKGYLVLKPGVEREQVQYLQGVDWRRTRAYALGINGLYLNIRGRERTGIVDPGAEREALLQELVVGLESMVDAPLAERDSLAEAPRVVKYAYRADKVYDGPYRDSGPDIIVGFYRGYRGSNESAMGSLPGVVVEDNPLKWSGDHCIAADEVPGILACNRPVERDDPNLLDLAPTILGYFGIRPPAGMVGGDLFSE